MMSSGLAPHGEHAVAFALTLNVSNPRSRANFVGTSVVCSTTIAFTGLHGAIETQRVATVVVTGGIVPLLVLRPGLPAVVVAHTHVGRAGVRKLRGPRERGGVGRGLERALRVVRVPDVDHERGDSEQHDEGEQRAGR